MKMNEILTLPDFSDLHVLVVGDIMVDRYISGKVRRISPEAPVPVVEMEQEENRLGGAANVALNLYALGAQTSIISIVGDDQDGECMNKMFKDAGNILYRPVTVAGRKTTVKTRIMSGEQHLLRIDNEETSDITSEVEKSVINSFVQLIESRPVDGLILQDYNKGLLTEALIKAIMKISLDKKIPTFIDPKERNFFSFTGCTVFKPNKKEILKALPGNEEDFEKLDKLLRERLHHQITFITLGSEGIYIHDGEKGKKITTTARIIADVCGAGDTVISIASLCYLKGLPIDKIAVIANIGGGQVCEVPGVVSVDRYKLENEISGLNQ